MLYRNHVLERLFQFYILDCISLRQKCNSIHAIHNLCLRKTISIWVSYIQTLKYLRQQFNRIHVIQNLCLKNTILVLNINLDISNSKIQYYSSYIEIILETLFQFYMSVWISLMQKFNSIHVKQKLCLINTILV